MNVYSSSKKENNEEITIKIKFNLYKYLSVGHKVGTKTNNINIDDQETDDFSFDEIEISISKADIVDVLLLARSMSTKTTRASSSGPGGSGRDFISLVGSDQFEIIAGYWSKNVDDQINVAWLNRVLNDCDIPEDATGKFISDMLKQAYFRILDQMNSKKGGINSRRIYSRKVILSVFAGD